jgi:4-amino-4-deoxy-L-arabinose transferase-like glycosyltransferase
MSEKPWLERKTPLKLTHAGLILAAITALAAYLRLIGLNSLGYANHYYAAAVESMLQSWHNFFFVAAEPGGIVSVDKPPVGLWLQTI